MAALAPYLAAAAPNGEDTLTFAELERQFKTLGAEATDTRETAAAAILAAARGILHPESCSSFSYNQLQSVEFRGRPPIHLVTLMARGRRASNGYVRLKKTLHGVA
jgi:hypothetical protein